MDTGCSLHDLQRVMSDREGQREKVNESVPSAIPDINDYI